MKSKLNILSFFSGCGGLDLGFHKAGFHTLWANDNSRSIEETYKKNFPNTDIQIQDITTIDIEELPQNIVGIIGGPPCQSWSAAGNRLGIKDKRGKLFLTFINIIKKKQPLFILAENVKGILSKSNQKAFTKICKQFDEAGYDLFVKCLNTANYGVPQKRERVIFIGFRKDLMINYTFPEPLKRKKTVKAAIGDLSKIDYVSSTNFISNNTAKFVNHELWEGGYSYIYMSRNRVLDWKSQSYTIQASARQIPIHPQAPPMEKIEKDVMIFSKENEHLYRRLTVRECARIQTFPDDFIFYYSNINEGYKMIGNAVPVHFAQKIAESIKNHLIPKMKELNL